MKKNYQMPVMKTGKINDQLLAGSGTVTNIDSGDAGFNPTPQPGTGGGAR